MRLTTFVLICGIASPLAAQRAPTPKPAARGAAMAPVRGPTVEGITEYDLSNGLKVLLFPDSSKPTITVNITYLVGSRYEGYGETGMAHLLEHMVFKGSPKHKNIPQELTEHGASPNGSTWYDRTNYFETFAATDTNLNWALDLESDRMVNSYIAKKDLESEMTVVRNEFESGENSPFNILIERTMETAYIWHNYGHPTIGARSDIEDVPIERLQAFYHKYYEPDNAVLVVAGKIDPQRTLKLVQQKFGAIPKPDRTGGMKIYPTYTVEPTQDGERSVTLRRTGDVQVGIAVYHIPAGSDSDFAATDVLGEVLGSAPSGRLYKALVETKKAAEVGAFTYQLREPGVLIAYAQVRQGNSLDSAMTALDGAIDSAVTAPPTKEEVDRAKASLIKNIELNLNNSSRVGLELSEWASMGDWRMLFLYRDRLKQVTPDDVQRAAARYLVRSNRTTGRFIPTEHPIRAEIPPTPDVAAMVKGYKGDTARVAGEAFDPSPANIDTRTAIDTLPSGIKLALLPKRTRGATVHAMMTFRFGTPQSIGGKDAIADLTADMMMRGSTMHTRQEIKDSLDKLEARVNVFGGTNSVRVMIETTRPNLPSVLGLVAEVAKSPAFDTSEFRALKQEDLANLEAQKSQPTALASLAYSRYMHPYPKNDPRYTPTFEEQAADYTAADVNDVRTFYNQFYGATHAEIAIVGDFDAGQVRSQITKLFGDWKSPGPFERVPQEYMDRPDTTIVIETPDKANAMFLAGENLPIRDDDPDYAALTLGNYMLGGGFLNSRLAVRIRQKEGISYGIGSFIGASSQDRSGQFTTYAIYAPQNRHRLEVAFQEEIARVLKDGFTADEVAQAKAGWLQSQEVRRAQDQGLASTWNNYLYIGRTFDYDADLDAKVKALTPAQINAAMRKYIDPSKIVRVEAGDFAKADSTSGSQH